VGVDRLVWGRGARFAFHYVGGDRLFWMAIVNAPEDQTEVGSGAKHALLERYRGWMAPVEAVIEATPEAALRMVRIYDREPADRWGEGRVTLLGDAAHPMTNNLGQGACQAIEDGVVLARCLSGRRDVVAALRSYEAQRMPRTARIQRAARTVGSIGRWSNPLVCAVRDQAIKRLFDGYVLRQNNAILTGTV
jgi:2-polyprenyl-6-methoxyphenol hydroxylase-like FAD-dependent oxidoreductase